MTKYNIKITGLLIYSRILDILTTYVAGSGSLRGETNFLVSVYNLGWFSLLIFNVLFIMISWFFIRKQTEKYYTEAENRLKSASISDLDFTDYFCYLYYSKKVTFVQFLTSAKINYKLLLNTFIHTFIVTVIIVGLIISINNLLNGYGFINLFSFDNLFYQKHMTKFLNFFVCAIVITVYHFLRYKKFIKTHINANQ